MLSYNYKNALLHYKVCVCPAFSFPLQIPDFTPNTGRYTPKSLCSSPNGLILNLKYSYGYITVSGAPSICHGGWGVLRVRRALRKNSGRGGFEWASLHRCARNYFGAGNLLHQSQYPNRLPVWLPGPQLIWKPSSAEHHGVQHLNRDCDTAINPTLTVKNWFFHFRGHELTQSSKYDLGPLTHNPII